MRIVNVIETDKDGDVVSIDSFPILEDQLSGEVVAEAEVLFAKKAIEYNISQDDIDTCIEDGYASIVIGGRLTLAWSKVNLVQW